MSEKSSKTKSPISSSESQETQITFRDRPQLPGGWVTRTPIRGGVTSHTSSPQNFGYNFTQNLRGYPPPRVSTTVEMATNDNTDQGAPTRGP